MAKKDVTAEQVRELFKYDPYSGALTLRADAVGRGCKRKAGDQVDVNGGNHGYKVVNLGASKYLAHRVVWLHVYGSWPSGVIDHIDGDRKNNRLSNLRDVSNAINCQNRRKARSCSSVGLLGVSRRKKYGKFTATIYIDGKTKHIGIFETPEQAHLAYLNAKRFLHAGSTL